MSNTGVLDRITDREKRKEAMVSMLTQFIKSDWNEHLANAWRDEMERVADRCFRLERDGDVWLPEFTAGSHISDACNAAWQIHVLTRQTVRFLFNGSAVQFEVQSKCGLDVR